MKIYKAIVDGADKTAIGRELLKKAVLEKYGVNDFSIYYNENKKPLTDICFFSISHKKDMVVCIIDEKEIGIDIEDIKDIKVRQEYKLFSKEESEYINSSENPSLSYITIFTMKEAYIKAKGLTLAYASKMNLVKDNNIVNSLKEFSFETRIEDGYITTICFQK